MPVIYSFVVGFLLVVSGYVLYEIVERISFFCWIFIVCGVIVLILAIRMMYGGI